MRQDLAVYKDEETEDENYKKQRAAAKSPEAKEATKLSQALYDGLLKLDLIMYVAVPMGTPGTPVGLPGA